MSLVLYSSSDSENEQDRPPPTKRLKQELPSVNIRLEHEIDLSEKDLITKSTDRTRLFAHERGNWAMSIYVHVPCSSHLDTMIDDLLETINTHDKRQWKRLNELHVSLSKTFPIRFHHIESIRKSLQNELTNSMTKFSARIDNVSVLTNENQSTSFLVFTLDQHRPFTQLVKIVDQVLQEYRYPSYYENPCFHVSFAYSTKTDCDEKLDDSWKSILQQYQCQPSALSVFIDDIRFKAGQRVYRLTNS